MVPYGRGHVNKQRVYRLVLNIVLGARALRYEVAE